MHFEEMHGRWPLLLFQNKIFSDGSLDDFSPDIDLYDFFHAIVMHLLRPCAPAANGRMDRIFPRYFIISYLKE